jgi:hypothetical protein
LCQQNRDAKSQNNRYPSRHDFPVSLITGAVG